jgi:predicted chitinase
MSLNAGVLQRAMPGLSAPLADKYVGLLRKAMIERNITTENRASAFLAQLGHESVSLRFFQEIADGSEYEGRLDLGNTQPGDGRRFKGRGPIQLTGRSNYRTYGQLLGLPLEQRPEMAADPKIGFRIAALFWQRMDGNRLADAGNFREITRRINGGFNGMADRESRLAAIKRLGAAVVPERSKQEKWRDELRKRREQLKTEETPSTRAFLMRRVDELKRALRRFRKQKHAGTGKPA